MTYAFLGPFKVSTSNRVCILSRSLDSSLVDQSLQICSRESNSTSSELGDINACNSVTIISALSPQVSEMKRLTGFIKDNVAHVMSENGESSTNIGKRDDYVSIESSGSDQRLWND